MNIFAKLNLESPVEISDYSRVTITTETAYQNGRGWTGYEAMQYENEVYPALRNAGFTIEKPDDDFGCPHLKIKEFGNKFDLYMHPESFTGYGKAEDIEKVIEVLKTCTKSIGKVELYYSEPVYDLNDYQYNDFLVSHSKEIVACIQEAMDKGIKNFGDIGFEFARNCRLNRVGDGSGISFSDTDVRTITNIYNVAKELGVFDREKEKKDPAQVLEEAQEENDDLDDR